MNTDIDQNEIDKLEKVLNDFKDEWEIMQSKRASKWRFYFFISFLVSLVLSLAFPKLWWTAIIVIGCFAGSLYSMLRLNAKTNSQIIEHQKQLKLVRLLNKFHASSFSSHK